MYYPLLPIRIETLVFLDYTPEPVNAGSFG